MAPLFNRLVDEYPDVVQITYRHFPLRSIHPFAQVAAEASEAAGAQGKFWEFHDLLYERQEQLNSSDSEAAVVDLLVSFAGELDLDTEQFRTDLVEGTYTAYVNTTVEEAENLGLPGTPAVFVDGELLPGNVPPYDVWVSFIESLQIAEQVEEELADRQYDAPPEMTIDEDAQYLATVALESGEHFVIELFPKSAPQTVNSFIFLAEEGWFDGVTFHRVLPGFVAQTGDPTGTGMGGPGYQLPNEIDPDLSHDEAGVVAMANSGPDTNGSQWYITLADASFLDGSYTIFGQVAEGMDVVQALTPRDPQQGSDLPPGDKIKTITIEKVDP